MTGEAGLDKRAFDSDGNFISANPDSKFQERCGALFVLTDQELMYEHNSRGHPGFNKLRREHGMTTVDAGQFPKCHHCLKWNTAAAPTKKKRRKKKEEKIDSELPLSEVHGDIAYLTVGTWDKEHYFQILVDVKTRKIWIQLLRLKGDHFDAFAWWYGRMVVEKPHLRLKKLTVGGEHDTKRFRQLALDRGFKLNILSPHSGKAWIAERSIGLIRRVAMPQLDYAGASPHDVGWSARRSVSLLNDSHTAVLPLGLTRNKAWEYEHWEKASPQQLELKAKKKRTQNIFGSLCFLKIFINNKSEPAAVPCMYLHTDEGNGQHVVRFLASNRIASSRNVVFDNSIMPCKDKNYRELVAEMLDNVCEDLPPDAEGGVLDMESAQNAISAVPVCSWKPAVFPSADELTIEQVGEINKALGIAAPHEPESQEATDRRTSTREKEPSSKALENIVNDADYDASLYAATAANSDSIYPIADPKNDKEAFGGPQKQEWIKADQAEMEEIWKRNTYDLVPPSEVPAGVKVISTRFVRKIKWKADPKMNFDGDKSAPKAFVIERFKSRWVAQAWNLQKGKDFECSYSAVIATDSERIMTAIAAWYGLKISAVDLKNFFLIGNMKDAGIEVFVKQAPGFEVAGKELGFAGSIKLSTATQSHQELLNTNL